MDFVHVLEHHLLDHVIFPGITLFGISMPITKHLLMMWTAGAILLATLPVLARNWPRVPGGARGAVEMMVVYFRDEVVLSNTGEGGRKYVPYFLTLFFFTTVTNLLGLIPGASSATGNTSVTGALGLSTLILMNVAGIREHGFLGHCKNFIPHGLPGWLLPLLVPLEIIGMFTRAFALAIRLFANMLAGHIVILSLISMIFLFSSIFVAPPAVGMSVALSLLEVFVAFLQAYILTLLSAIFVGAAIQGH